MSSTEIFTLGSVAVNIFVMLLQSRIKADIQQLRADIAEKYLAKEDFREAMHAWRRHQ